MFTNKIRAFSTDHNYFLELSPLRSVNLCWNSVFRWVLLVADDGLDEDELAVAFVKLVCNKSGLGLVERVDIINSGDSLVTGSTIFSGFLWRFCVELEDEHGVG